MRNWKKMFIVVLLVSIGVGFEYSKSYTRVHAASSLQVNDSVVQKPTDPPKDRPIQVAMSNGGKFCYGPIFSGGESYVIIEQCWERHVKNARYDVFQRISYNVNNTWLCITAPATVVKGNAKWDYVNLRPCAINDPLQRWIVKENSFWTADGLYRLKDTNWYGYISRNSKDRYNHTLDTSMGDWVKTIATPGNISIKTSIVWSSWGNGIWNIDMAPSAYYLHSTGSNKSITSLYYNPESGHFAQYDIVSGSLYCMYSKMTDKYDWNWVKWTLCSDAPIKKENPAYWNVYFVANAGGIITDYKGNVLRVTKEGSNWGVAYAVKPSYLEKDTTNKPNSLFAVDVDLLKWIRYTTSNLGKTDQYCPAGNKESHIYKRVKRNLPSDFQLSVAWVQRLYDIARSATFESANPGAIPQRHGSCGVCMLHSFQMIAELMEYHSRDPLTSGGYFFDTTSNRDPFLSFSQRYPELDRLLTNVPVDYANRGRVLAFASTGIMLPQYEWESSSRFTTRSDIVSYISSLINSAPGSIWLGLMRRQRADGFISGHAVPILRTSQGLVVIPTNMPTISLSSFIQSVAPTTDPNEVLAQMEEGRTMTELVTIRPVGTYENPFSLTVSSRNCTGEGEDRRGSGQYPNSASVNQCKGGRCILL
ncbi:DUF1561 domain-containing protein [Leptospira kirschneri]|uniref:DUF1561 domain-containing protein n=1 Tax=Leptospira kirschneri TaxID=29507 RepID=UPI000310739A|nr:DUF1561 domain-containing protein [Leptospira kirschneri]EPG48826.1 PF07598 family protein [Leptospira kirschneri serovar Cynopteri str. 3522 CT]